MRRSTRPQAPKIWFEQTDTSAESTKPKKAPKKAIPTPQARAASPTAIPIIRAAEAYEQRAFTPPFKVPFMPMQVRWIERDPFSLFMRFLGLASLTAIVEATNAKAISSMHQNPEFARKWTPLTQGELLCWLGLLFYMANHTQIRRNEYWRNSDGLLSRFMGRSRWEQIHRFLTFSIESIDESITQSTQPKPWFSKVEPIYSIVRANCRDAVIPATWLSVDESMIPFRGRTRHTVRLPHKPIPEGYKAWVLGSYGGYIIDWLIHSPVDGPEYCDHEKRRIYQQPIPLRPVALSSTFQVPITLFQRLRSIHPYLECLAFLDNLFLNVDVAHVLMHLKIGVMGTTRKSSAGFPQQLQAVKDLNKSLLYGGSLTSQSEWALCFAWQDNNVVLGLTTAFSLNTDDDYIVRSRRRPKNSSINAKIAQPVFGNEVRKDLPIPRAIDAYNHAMNAVDVANQLRQNFTCHLAWETRNWRPIGYWLFDVCLTNSYLIWKAYQPQEAQESHRLHERFEKALIQQLLYRGPFHQLERLERRGRCRWGAHNASSCLVNAQKRHYSPPRRHLRNREVLKRVVNESRPLPRYRNVIWGCKACNVHLCKGTSCFSNWHAELYAKYM